MNPIRKVNFALRLLAQGQTSEAAELSAQLLQESPEVAEVHALACELASVQERGQDALEHIERSIQLEPERHDFRLRKAGIQLVLRQGLAAQATAMLSEAEIAAARAFFTSFSMRPISCSRALRTFFFSSTASCSRRAGSAAAPPRA